MPQSRHQKVHYLSKMAALQSSILLNIKPPLYFSLVNLLNGNCGIQFYLQGHSIWCITYAIGFFYRPPTDSLWTASLLEWNGWFLYPRIVDQIRDTRIGAASLLARPNFYEWNFNACQLTVGLKTVPPRTTAICHSLIPFKKHN